MRPSVYDWRSHQGGAKCSSRKGALCGIGHKDKQAEEIGAYRCGNHNLGLTPQRCRLDLLTEASHHQGCPDVGELSKPLDHAVHLQID